jgi:hypothetical protein
VYAVCSVDEGIELLSGVPAQEVHARVEGRLAEFADKARDFALAAAKKQARPRK